MNDTNIEHHENIGGSGAMPLTQSRHKGVRGARTNESQTHVLHIHTHTKIIITRNNVSNIDVAELSLVQ